MRLLDGVGLISVVTSFFEHSLIGGKSLEDDSLFRDPLRTALSLSLIFAVHCLKYMLILADVCKIQTNSYFHHRCKFGPFLAAHRLFFANGFFRPEDFTVGPQHLQSLFSTSRQIRIMTFFAWPQYHSDPLDFLGTNAWFDVRKIQMIERNFVFFQQSALFLICHLPICLKFRGTMLGMFWAHLRCCRQWLIDQTYSVATAVIFFENHSMQTWSFHHICWHFQWKVRNKIISARDENSQNEKQQNSFSK